MSDVLQRRYLATGGIAAKPTSARSGNAIGHLSGYAAVFDTLSHDLGGWRERIAPGAFAAAMRSSKHPILALYDHTVGHLLASTRAGTLTLSEDKIGLRFTIALPDTTLGRDVMALVRRGDLAGASIGFVLDKRATDWVKATGRRSRERDPTSENPARDQRGRPARVPDGLHAGGRCEARDTGPGSMPRRRREDAAGNG